MLRSDIFGVRLTRIGFNDGTEIALSENSILVLTGANNCGKSQCLKDIIFSHIADDKSPVVVKELDKVYLGNAYENVKKQVNSDKVFKERIHRWTEDVDEKVRSDSFAYIRRIARESAYSFKYILDFFFLYLNTVSRLVGFVDRNRGMYDDIEYQFDQRIIDIKKIYEDREFEECIYNIVKSSFDRSVVLNRATFDDVSLNYMDQNLILQRDDLGKPSFSRFMEAQPKLSDQGDGIVSFCNIVISVFLNERPLILLDEPEAFLHPPQIRSLAKVIADHIGGETQLIVSTHSHDFVQALIDFSGKRTSVVRLSRSVKDGLDVNHVRQLDSSSISNLWRDPLLKMSDVLTSLFHHVAVIVEGDSDARFFKAMFDAQTDRNKIILDLRFFHCGGKDRIAKIADALRAIGVPLVCTVDIDILDNKDKFSRLYTAFGGDFSEIRDDVIFIIKYVEEQRAVESAGNALDEIKKIFEKLETQKPIPNEQAQAVLQIIRKSSAWSLVKRSGESFFSRGEPTNRLRRIFSRSSEVGIFINPYGELENLCKTVEARKGEWLDAALRKDLKNDLDLEDARSFSLQILSKCEQVSGLKIPEV